MEANIPESLEIAEQERTELMQWLQQMQEQIPQAQARIAFLNGAIEIYKKYQQPELEQLVK
jgi:hypothetical protein